MRRNLIAALFTLYVATVCQSQPPPFEAGDAEDLRGVTKVFIGPDRKGDAQKKISETIRKSLPHIEFVSNLNDAEIWLSLILVPKSERSRVPPNPNNPQAARQESFDLSYEAVGRILRLRRDAQARLVSTYRGKASDKGTLSKNFAKEFVKIYQGVNVNFRPAPSTKPAFPDDVTKADAARSSQAEPGEEQSTASNDVEILRVNTDLVSINVGVIDRASRYVSTLSADAFSVYDKGVKQELSFFASVDEPFTVALLIDTSKSVKFKLQDIVKAANLFVEELRPDDRLMVFTFDRGLREIVKTTRSEDVKGRGLSVTPVDGSETLLYDAVSFAINQRLNRIRGRKAMVILTDGVSSDGSATYKSSLRDAEEAGALIYPIQFDTFSDAAEPFKSPAASRMLNLTKLLYQRASAYLEELATKTGGRRYRATEASDFPQAFAGIVKELRGQYSLGFYPRPLPRHGERRRIKVEVKMPNVAVRTRREYIFTTQADLPKKK